MHRSFRVLSNLSRSPGKILLPGFGRGLNYEPDEHDPNFVGPLFPSILQHWPYTIPMTTLRELTMLQVMNNITDKPDWHIKIKERSIAHRWKMEALASGRDITEKMINWCIDELTWRANMVPNHPAVPPPVFVYHGDVFKCDKFAGSAKLKKELQEAIRNFEKRIPENMKDWHPNSDGKVWDLVHPSLFPLVYGRTRILANGETTNLDDFIERCGQGEIIPVPGEDRAVESGGASKAFNTPELSFSTKFQWLPCEVDLTQKEVKIISYINNLHPHFEKPLYRLIEKLISASIPLWEKSLAPLRNPKSKWRQRIEYNTTKFDPPEPRTNKKDPFAYWDKKFAWEELPRRVVLPEPPRSFRPIKRPPAFNLRQEYRNQGLQVIVKLANIQLTPDKPEYNGGSWHIEGQMNEHIVATSLHYYDCENVTPSTLYFRQLVSDETVNIHYPQDVHEWLPAVFGIEQNGPTVQEIGGVKTREGRLLSFPNVLQHRVGPFKLENPTKPGHRKMVALFLVDPNIKIISTAHVPCQRQDWWQDWKDNPPQSLKASGAPAESPSLIPENVDFPISLKEAGELRLELMEKRKEFVITQNDSLLDETISLCEH